MASIADGWPTITRTSGHKPLRPEAMIPIRKAHLDGRAGQWQAYGSVSIYGTLSFGGDKKYLYQNGLSLDERRSRIPAAMAAKRSGNRLLDYQHPLHPRIASAISTRKERNRTEKISRSSGMDLGLAWDLLTNCIEASTVLDTDKAFRQQCMDVRANLQPFRIGSKGQLLEWDKEFEETDPNHRHVSHLFALHPGRQIIPEQQPELAAACQRTLEIRGDGGTRLAMAWKINFWARLRDGNHAFGMLKNGLRYVDATQVSVRGGGTYANLFDAIPLPD